MITQFNPLASHCDTFKFSYSERIFYLKTYTFGMSDFYFLTFFILLTKSRLWIFPPPLRLTVFGKADEMPLCRLNEHFRENLRHMRRNTFVLYPLAREPTGSQNKHWWACSFYSVAVRSSSEVLWGQWDRPANWKRVWCAPMKSTSRESLPASLVLQSTVTAHTPACSAHT